MTRKCLQRTLYQTRFLPSWEVGYRVELSSASTDPTRHHLHGWTTYPKVLISTWRLFWQSHYMLKALPSLKQSLHLKGTNSHYQPYFFPEGRLTPAAFVVPRMKKIKKSGLMIPKAQRAFPEPEPAQKLYTKATDFWEQWCRNPGVLKC